MYTAKNSYVINAVTESDQMILDVGCGTGGSASEIKNRFPDSHITGLNNDASELELAAEYITQGHQVDLNNLPVELLNNEYDLIICSHVLEHLINPKKLLSVLKNHLKENGRIIVLVPNFGIWNARLKVLCGGFAYEESGLYDRTHLRFYTYHSLVDELLADGLLVKEKLAHGHFPLPLIRELLPITLIAKLNRWALRFLPNLFAHEIGLVLSKR